MRVLLANRCGSHAARKGERDVRHVCANSAVHGPLESSSGPTPEDAQWVRLGIVEVNSAMEPMCSASLGVAA